MSTALRESREQQKSPSTRARLHPERPVSRQAHAGRWERGETHLERLERLRGTAQDLRQTMVRLGDTILARVPNEGLSEGQLTALDARLAGANLQLRVLEHVLLALDTINEGNAASL